jgi:hypothetical protein
MTGTSRLFSGVMFAITLRIAYQNGGIEWALIAIGFGLGVAVHLMHEIRKQGKE